MKMKKAKSTAAVLAVMALTAGFTATSVQAQTINENLTVIGKVTSTEGVTTTNVTAQGNTSVGGILSVGNGGTIDGVPQSTRIQGNTILTNTLTTNAINSASGGVLSVNGVDFFNGRLDADGGIIDDLTTTTLQAHESIQVGDSKNPLETTRINGGAISTGELRAAGSKFVVDKTTGNVTTEGSLSVGKKDPVTGESAFTVNDEGYIRSAYGGDIGGVLLNGGRVVAENGISAAQGQFVVDGATGAVKATSFTVTSNGEEVNVGDAFAEYKDAGIVAGTSTADYDIALGAGSQSSGMYAVAFGDQANAAGFGSMALGAHASATGNNSVALGFGSIASENNVVSVGGYADGTQRRIVNVEDGVNEHDAATVGQLQDALSNVGIDAEGGNVVQADKDGNVTIDGNLDVNGGLTVGDTVISGEELAGVADISGIKTDVKTNASNITALQDKVGSGDIKVKDANGSAVTNLTDAVNANYTQIQNNSNAISSLGNRVSDLGDEIDSVGAISAALAGLHPLDYDGTGSKFQISAAMGTYDGTQAAAIGGFYHFNRDVMLSLGGATSFEGDKKTAANIGVTFRVGEGASGKSVSDDVMARLEAMDQKIAALEQENKNLKNVLGAIDTSLSKEFPDVPANHWAYEAVTKLAGNNVVAGYPDGEFHGDRTMTRYEMAEIIYKAMSKGVQVDPKLVEEFKPEMEQVAANQNA
ncbi:S-layer homology domain-containing protein [Megasphaera stantonii]|uniref:S-layer homology domain-containing protein n=1 Tax=Megasphaera stantonii TaxID=2144175 RepID=UPI002943F35A|nr:S-layer homology domain-containing protein [Megasphaera stantonii]